MNKQPSMSNSGGGGGSSGGGGNGNNSDNGNQPGNSGNGGNGNDSKHRSSLSAFFHRPSLATVPGLSSFRASGSSDSSTPKSPRSPKQARPDVCISAVLEFENVKARRKSLQMSSSGPLVGGSHHHPHHYLAHHSHHHVHHEQSTSASTTPVPEYLNSQPSTSGTRTVGQWSEGLGTINEQSMEDVASQKLVEVEIEPASQTDSSSSVPDYLTGKFPHSVTPTSGVSHEHDLPPPPPPSLGSKSPLVLADGLSLPFEAMVAKMSPSNHSRLESPTTTTTTSESYQLNELPPLPARLATLSKPTPQSLLASALRSRKARHSIDVRALPSYLARKRGSTFGQFLSTFSPTAPEESSSSDDPLFSEPVAPTLSLGERVAWVKSSGPEFGNVKWIGRMPPITNDWTVGIEFDNAIGSGDGTFEGRRYFVSKENFAKFLPLSDLTKVDNYAGRPRSGTMLSRMSVQLKPGQLISIQRSPTTVVPHCSLNAPHHVGHDVHSPNNRHCQCPSCNHPCAHICKTRKPKGKRWTEDMAHMCHFSSKPHAQMCCGGEDLPTASCIEPGASWKHNEVIASLRTVPTEAFQSSRRRSNVNHHLNHNNHVDASPPPPLFHPSDSSPHQASHHQQHQHHHHQHRSHSGGRENSYHYQAQQQQQQPPLPQKSAHFQQSSHSVTQNSKKSVKHPNSVVNARQPTSPYYGAGILERSGSDLSISSLPSSSSVAEVFINRSVLTDESDIDSETEQSLASSRKKVATTGKQGLRQIVATFLANSLRLKRFDKKEKKHDDDDDNFYFSHPNGYRNKNKRTKKSTRDGKSSRHRNKMHRSAGLSSTDDGSSYTELPAITNGFRANETLKRPATLFSTTARTPAQIPSACTKPGYNRYNQQQTTSMCNDASCRMHECNCSTARPCDLSEETSTSGRSSAPRSIHTQPERPSTNASCESVPSPRKRKIKGPAPKPPTTASNSMMSNVTNVGSPATAVSTSCPSSLPQSPTNSSVITNSHSNSSKTKLSSSSRSKGCAPPPPSIASNSKNDSSNDATVRASDKDEENLVLLVNASLSQPKVYSYEQSTETLKNDRKKQLVAEDESIYQLPLPVAVAAAFSAAASREHPPELPTKTFDPLKAFGCRLNNQTCKLESHDSRKSPLGDAERLTRSQSMPFTNPTCCLHHWKEYLNTLTMTSTVLKGESAKDVAAAVVNHLTELNRKRRESDEEDDEDEEEEEEDDECDDNSSCHAHHNHLIDALLSPKHTHKLSNGKQSTKSQNSSIHDDLSTLCHAFANCELLRALSDGSLTNTSAATVVEYIQDDAEPKKKNKNNALVQTSPNKQNQQQQQKLNCNIPSSVHSRPFLSDVFCQTTFDENPLESTLSTVLSHPLCALPSTATLTRKHKPHKSYSCRCRKSHKNRTNCRHRQCHREDFNNNNPNSDNGIPGFVPFQPTGITGMSPATWLTSSTSEHSEMSSSMSSSTSTLSDGSSLRASNNLTDYRRNCSGMFAGNCSNQQNSTVASLMNPFPFLESDQPANQFFMNAEQVFEPIHAQAPPSGRSSVSSDKLLKSKVDPYSYPLPAELDPELANNHRPEMFMGSLKLVNSNLPTTEEAQNKCLMTELEVAIANGNHHRAAILAKELAIKRANCQLARNDKTPIVAYLYVEDRNNHRGPIPFQVYPSMTVNMLKLKVEKEFGFGCDQQKWVLGRNIATNMGASLASYGINHSGCPIFLYVLTSPTARATPSNGTGSEVSAGEFVGKTNGNLSDESDTVYESLRSTASTVPLHYPLFENGTKSIDTDKASTRFGPPEVTDMNGGGGYESNEHQQNQAQNLVKNYFYQEGEVPFANELVFEALAVANEMLPRVEEEDEEDLSQEEEVETIAERRTNNPLPQPEMMPNLIKVPVTGTTPTPIVVAATVTPLRANGGTYKQLMDLEDVKCVRNVEPFDCPVCLNHFKQGEGVVLRDCLHTFCRECLMATIEYCEEVQVKCPFRDAFYACEVPFQDREVRELSTEEIYERYLRRSVAVAEKNVEQSFHCKTVDCAGWCVYDDNVNIFRCPVCEHENCINCQAVHEGVNCLQFQEELEFNAANDQDAKATKQFLEEMLTKDEAMRCPQCKVVLMKKWGCDWVKCSMCDTEICWITKGFRWGPNGRGDTSGGCKCMVGGIRCSPECKYCH